MVQAFNEAGNKGDRNAYVSYCTDDAVMIDREPPYLFRGPTACGDEWDAVVSWSAEHKISADQLSIKFSAPVLVDVAGDRAYAVFPITGRFTMNGTKMLEPEYATFVLRRQSQGWRIAGLSWSTLGWKPIHKHR